MALSKRKAQQLAVARQKRRQIDGRDERAEFANAVNNDAPVYEQAPLETAHWYHEIDSGSDSETDEDDELDDIQYQEFEGTDSFREMMESANLGQTASLKYCRGADFSERHKRRLREEDRKLQSTANKHSQPLTNFFKPLSTIEPKAPDAVQSKEEVMVAGTSDMEIKLKQLKKEGLGGPNLLRHEAVLRLLYSTLRRTEGQSREDISLNVAKTFNKGPSLAKKLVTWEGEWLRNRKISETRWGKFVKVQSLLDDEGVELTVRSYIEKSGERRLNEW